MRLLPKQSMAGLQLSVLLAAEVTVLGGHPVAFLGFKTGTKVVAFSTPGLD